MSKNLQNALSNADKLDGLESTQFVRSDSNSTAQGHYIFQNSNPLPSNRSYTNNNLELRTVDNSAPTLGFHRAGYSAAAIIEQGGQLHVNSDYDGTLYKIWHAGNDGTGSGLDADTLDGIQGSDLVKRIEFDGLVDSRLLNGGTVKTLYVDQINGNDANTGTSTSPFKNLQKAIDTIPSGGRGLIYLVGDYTLNSDVYIANKMINITPLGTLTTTSYTDSTGAYEYLYSILLNSSDLLISIDSSQNGKIVVPAKTTTTTVAPSGDGFIKHLDVRSSNLTIMLRTIADNYNPIEVNGYSLVSIHEWSSNRSFSSTSIVGYYAGVNRSIIVDQAAGAELVKIKNSTYAIYVNYTGGITDTAGTSLAIGSIVSGVVKDANGTPRNVISNVIF